MDNIVRTWEDIELTDAELELTDAEIELTEAELGVIYGAAGTLTLDGIPLTSGTVTFIGTFSGTF